MNFPGTSIVRTNFIPDPICYKVTEPSWVHSSMYHRNISSMYENVDLYDDFDNLWRYSKVDFIFNISIMSSMRGDSAYGDTGLGGKTKDCQHFCLPGVPDIWNSLLFHFLSKTLR